MFNKSSQLTDNPIYVNSIVFWNSNSTIELRSLWNFIYHQTNFREDSPICMAAHIPQDSPKKISEFSHHHRPGAIRFKFRTKIQRKSAFSWPFFHKISYFGHNFLTDAIFSNPLSQAIYILPVLRRDTHIDHIYSHINPYKNGHYGYFAEIGHYGLT